MNEETAHALVHDAFAQSMREPRSCTVLATSLAYGITYSDAYSRLKALGRKHGRGFKFSKAAHKWGMVQRPELSCRTWRKVAPALTNGKFIVRVSHHVFAVRNGIASESVPPGRRIKMVYQVPDL